MVIKISEILSHNNTTPIEFVISNNNYKLKEDNEYIPKSTQAGIPRFTIKGNKDIENIEINKPMTPTEDLFIKAIKYGMIFSVTYKGAKDNHNAGHERVIYPMVFGRSSTGALLLRGFHLKGWSISNNRNIEKIWRLFRFDRFKTITFTGSFYRLPPTGYNMHDKGMRGGIIARADFNEIRRNQESLAKKKEIQNRKDIELEPETKNEFVQIIVKSTDTQLDMLKPYENPYVENEKNAANLRLTFLKSLYGTTYYAIIGTVGQSGNTVKIKEEKGKDLGIFKILDSISGETLKKIKKVKGNTIFDLYIFNEKI